MLFRLVDSHSLSSLICFSLLQYCKDAAKTCSGYSRSEWKDFITDKCKFKFE